MTSYLTEVAGCAKGGSPVVCLEEADHKLGDEIHDYANVLATGHGFSAPRTELSTTLNEAQLLANSLEILGDAGQLRPGAQHLQHQLGDHAAAGRRQHIDGVAR